MMGWMLFGLAESGRGNALNATSLRRADMTTFKVL
jgi:hypothetical protein